MARSDMKSKYFIITIDTEGDNIWKRVITSSGMREIQTENAKFVSRFQRLCEKYYFKPTYLVNYEMASAEPFVSQAKEWLRDGECEIGMHMHAWNTPPVYHLPFNRKGHNPFAGEYPRRILWKKLSMMTEMLEDTFGERPTSHRGGRWYIDPWYIHALLKLGYRVDCSVTPGINWNKAIGNTMYGPDYSNFPREAYFMDRKKLDKAVKQSNMANSILQIPPTIMNTALSDRLQKALENPFDIKAIASEKIWLRPNGKNLKEMLYLVEKTRDRNYIEFMLHSSELMPGGSPVFVTEQAIEKLYSDMDILFSEISKVRAGVTLSEYTSLFKKEKLK